MKQKRKPAQVDGKGIAGLLIGAIIVLLLLGWIQNALEVNQPETILGLLMAQIVIALMILLFIMSIGFTLLGLADPQQALGLPEGSIRAMISLFMILIFVTLGLYLFRTVAGLTGPTLHCQTADQVKEFGDRVIAKQSEQCLDQPEAYKIIIRMDTSEQGVDLAKQLINTIGTLVVALSGFYFGTRAVQAARGVATSDEPRIRSVDPTSESKSKSPISITVSGEGFMMADTVKLKKGAKEYAAEEITSNASKIVAKFNISDVPLDLDKDKEKDTKFDLIVVNKDGAEDLLGDAFIIKPATQTQTPNPNASPTPKPDPKIK